MQLGRELLPVFLEQRLDGPVLDRFERADLALSLDEKTERNSLHPSCGNSLLHRLPQNRTRLVTDESIEHPAGLLSVYFALVDFARVLNRVLNCVAGDLVEQHPADRRAVARFDL